MTPLGEAEKVLLLTVDSLRADHVGVLGYHRDTTPFLDSFAGQSRVFSRAYAASVHTRESIPSIMTGTYPPEAVSRLYRFRRQSIASMLASVGYDTGAFLASPFFTREFGYHRGFDVFDSEYAHTAPGMAVKYLAELLANRHYRDGYDLNQGIVDFLETRSGPSFVWGHYMDVHGPYNRFDEIHFGTDVSSRRLQLLFRRAKYMPWSISADQRAILVDAYDNAIRYFDGVMEALLEKLQRRDLLSETAIVFVADHGESFGENGMYEHKRYLGEELLHVPLLVYDGEDSGWIDEPVSTVDIFRTITDMAGIDDPDVDRSDSRSLTNRSRVTGIHASCLNFFRRQERTITLD